jgi:hypothetical protein
MIYQLGTFEKWIRSEIHPKELVQDRSNSQLSQHLQFADIEKERIFGYFREKAINGEPPIPTPKFIQAHQVGINVIIDTIIGYAQSTEHALLPEEQIFYNKICQVIEEINIFIEQHLPEHFDDELPISYTNAELTRTYLNKQLQLLQPVFQNSTLDKALLRIAIRPLQEFVDEEKQISFRERAYLKELASNFQGLLYLDENADITYELHLILLQLNFNYPRYILHYSYWLDAKLSEIPDRTRRLDELAWNIHAIEQIHFKPPFVLIPALPSLKEQLLVSIKTTYQYLLTEEKPVRHTVVEQISGEATTRPKIRLSISVAVLAIFLKLLIMAGIIKNENKAEVFRVVVENFSTLKSEQLSYDSLKGRYNTPRTGTDRVLKKILYYLLTFLK